MRKHHDGICMDILYRIISCFIIVLLGYMLYKIISCVIIVLGCTVYQIIPCFIIVLGYMLYQIISCLLKLLGYIKSCVMSNYVMLKHLIFYLFILYNRKVYIRTQHNSSHKSRWSSSYAPLQAF